MSQTMFPIPVANGRLDSTNSCVLTTDNDTNLNKYVAQFADGVTEDLHFFWPTPANWLSGTATLRLRWRANATTGDCVWNVLYSSLLSGNGFTGAATTNTITTTTAGTANFINESSTTLTVSAINRGIPMIIRRTGAAGGDTLAATAELLEMIMEYTSDPTITKVYVFVPCQAMAIPATSGAARSSVALNTNTKPQTITLRVSNTDFVDIQYKLPSNYLANFAISTYVCNNASSGNPFEFRHDVGASPQGSTDDPTLTTGTKFSMTMTAIQTFVVDANRASILAPNANDTVIVRVNGLGSDGGWTNTGNANLIGIGFSYDVSSRNPGVCVFDPASAALASGTNVTLAQDNDTNSSKYVAQMPSAQDQLIDFVGFLPSLYSTGGTLRVRWRANAASGNAAFSVDHGSPASGAASDPALTTGTNFLSACGGANVINEWTQDISSGFAASDNLAIRIWRRGSTGSETGAVASVTVEILDIQLESTVTAG